MKVVGDGNLRTMNPLAKATIDDAKSVKVYTKRGRLELVEMDDGSIEVRASGGDGGGMARAAILPLGTGHFRVEIVQ